MCQQEPQKDTRSKHKTLNDAKERLRTIERLRREAEALRIHADVLQAETDHLIRTGKLWMEEETLP
jgi:hypothetical protein